jgi:hypothetical protein
MVLLLVGGAMAQEETPTPEPEREGYGKALWGMSEAEVKAIVEGEPQAVDGGFAVDTTVAGHPAGVMYGFTQDKLTLVIVLFMDSHMEPNKYLADWQTISDLLTEKYGTPSDQEWVWLNDLFKDDPDQYGTAIAAEQLVVYRTWRTDQTEIEHSLQGKGFDVIHKILYTSRSHDQMREREQKQKSLDGL